jgi:cell division septum initiation protein DivIVA
MARRNRKSAKLKGSQGSRRGRSLRRGDKNREDEPRQADQGSSGESREEGKASLGDGGNVSSLLETTSKDVRELLEAADDAAEKVRQAAQAEKGPGSKKGEDDDVTVLVSKVNEEAREVLEAADEAAERIREEARAEAKQVVDQARRRTEAVTREQMDRVSEATDELLGQLAAVKRQLDSLRTAFHRAMQSMGSELGVEPSEVWSTKRNGLDAEQESEQLRERLGNRPRPTSVTEPEGISEGARLLALQQMMAGVDPEVIERRLREEFGIEDPRPILEWMGLQAEGARKREQSKKR